jgi:HEAT repeat protein
VTDTRPNIWQLQAQGDSKGLIAALQNSEADVCKRAATALRVLGAVEALPALRQALESDPDEDLKTHLQSVIDSLLAEQPKADNEPTSELIAQLDSDDPAVIIKAAYDLGRLQDKTAVDALVRLFHNRQLSPKVRLTAAEALVALESAPAVVTLLAALKSESWKVRRNAAAVLGQLRADWAVERLAERLTDESEHVVRTARAALHRIGTDQALAAIDDYLRTQTLKEAKIKTGTLPEIKPSSE